MADGDSLGALLTRLRGRAGLSQEQLADRSGVSAQAISDIERGTTLHPRAGTLHRIAAGLGLDAAGLERLVTRGRRGPAPDGAIPGSVPAGHPDEIFAATSLGQAVSYLRTRLGLTPAELGELSGLSTRTIADIEAGRRARVQPANGVRLAAALRLDGAARERFLQLASGLIVPDRVRLGATAPAGFTGRAQELAIIAALLSDHQLVNLYGPGGVGKTTVAKAVLSILAKPCASLFLADIPAGEDLPRAIAQISRIDESAGESWVNQLSPLLPPGSVLLLDNLEHLRRVPEAMQEILSSRPDITVLATSRKTIGLTVAHELEIRPLGMAEACQLFLTAAEAAGRPVQVSPVIGVIERICTRLDRLPLTITLAAQWTRIMTPRDVLARLDSPAKVLRSPDSWPGGNISGLDARHTAITLTVGWSLALVSGPAQELFCGMATYPAPWPLDLAEAILPGTDVLSALGELVEARLVSAEADETGRAVYSMLQTVSDAGHAQLAADPVLADQVQERHAAHLLARARQIRPRFGTADHAAAMADGDQLALHMEAALRYLISADDRRAISLVAAWWRYWKERGRYRSGLTLVSGALRMPEEQDGKTHDTAEAQYGAAVLAYLAGENERAANLGKDALACFRRLGDASGIGNLMSLIGMMELHGGRPDRALELFQHGLREVDDKAAPRAYATLLANIAPVHAALGDLPAAREAAGNAAARFQVLGDTGAVANQLGNLGSWTARAGDLDRAAELLRECRDLQAAAGDISSLTEAYLGLAQVHVIRGDAAAARADLDEARRLDASTDDAWGDALADAIAAQVAVLVGDMLTARSLARAAMRKGETITYQPAVVGAALAEASAAAWTGDRWGALAAVRAGLAQSAQADEAMVISLALIAVAVHMDGSGPATADAGLLELEQDIRQWASTSAGRPYAIAALASRRRGLTLAHTRLDSALAPIATVRARAVALCPSGAAAG